MALGTDYSSQDCSVARALELLGERWTMLIVRDAFYGVRRYSDFLAHLRAPRAVLSARLARLVQAGVLAKVRYQDNPVRDEYRLTDKGIELWPVLHSLSRWGERHHPGAQGPRRVFVHSPCQAPLDPNGGCAHCGVVPTVDAIEVHPGPGAEADPADDAVTRALRRPHRLLEPL